MGHNAGRHIPVYLVPQSLDPGAQISHQEDIYSRGSERQGLFRPDHHRMFIGIYVRPYYVPPLLPHCQHKTYHVRDVIHHTFDLPDLLPPPRNGDSTLVLVLRLCCPYGVAGALPCVDILRQLCLLEDSDPHISLL